ncbi:MAG: hypothetical protein ILP13_06990 [Lachnospiraceae bacterium]|nr:hypothetical protein [Lachnospiraceae bacterium]
MFRKTIKSTLLIIALGICLTGCGDKATATDNTDSTAYTESQNSADKVKSEVSAGPWVTYVNPQEGQVPEGEGSGEFNIKKSGITWYVDEYTTVMRYEGEIAEQFAKDYYDGKNVDLYFELSSGDSIEIRKHEEAGHLQFSYLVNGKAGMYCDNFEESFVRDYGCNNDFEICGYTEDNAVYVCIYHNGPYVGPEDFPYVSINYCDLDNQNETMLHDQCGNSSQEYSTDVPERFTGKIGECKNLYSLADFSFADTSKAKTDDYQLNMGNEGYIELISYNEAGKVVDVISFSRNSETGEILEGEGYARGKYLDFQNFTASKSIFAYPVYFSKPYLTPSQFGGMEDN